MDESTKAKCHTIIHSAAIGCAAGNFAPTPGIGIAADVVAMTTMTMSLASLLGGDISAEAAKGLVITELKKQTLKKPLKIIAKEASKVIPGLGQVVAPSFSFAMIEAVGWEIAKKLDRKINRNDCSDERRF